MLSLREPFIKNWKKRNKNNGQNNDVYFLINVRNRAAEKITQQRHTQDPGNAANHIIRKKFFIIHAAYSGQGRGKSAHNRNKAGNDNSFRAVFFVKFLSFEDVGFIKEE